jgi:hypothetical protein
VQALSYFAAKEEDCKLQITEVLAHIEKRNLLPPLTVIDALARNSTVGVGTRFLVRFQRLSWRESGLISQKQNDLQNDTY